ncbi:MAG: hypothetical protein ABIR71_08970 [Chthoniobacterales bacterium]
MFKRSLPGVRSVMLLLLLVAPAMGAKPRPKPKPAAVSFEIAPAPAWVKPISLASDAPVRPGDGGISYLLLDRQESVEPSAYYFHSIRLTRAGVVADRLDRAQIKLFQRERSMEAFLYDGTYTAVRNGRRAGGGHDRRHEPGEAGQILQHFLPPVELSRWPTRDAGGLSRASEARVLGQKPDAQTAHHHRAGYDRVAGGRNRRAGHADSTRTRRSTTNRAAGCK